MCLVVRYFFISLGLVILQTTLVRFMAIETIVPDLLLIWIVAIALVEGQAAAITAGFILGLGIDLLSGHDGMLGLAALSKTVAGFVAGFFHDDNRVMPALGRYQFPLIHGDCRRRPQPCLLRDLPPGFGHRVDKRDRRLRYPVNGVHRRTLADPHDGVRPESKSVDMTLQDDIQVHSKRRVLHVAVGLIFLLFVCRLFQLQMIYRVEYGRKSDENSIRTIPHDPVRGNMYDRNHLLVVDNRPAFTVTVMPYEFHANEIPYLASILNLEPDFIKDRLKKGEQISRFQPVKLRRDIDFRMLSTIEEHRDRLSGVDYVVESKRDYPTIAKASTSARLRKRDLRDSAEIHER